MGGTGYRTHTLGFADPPLCQLYHPSADDQLDIGKRIKGEKNA